MLKYHKNPTERYLKSWKMNYKTRHDDYDEIMRDVAYYNFEPEFTMNMNRSTNDDVPKKFIDFWEFRKKLSVKLVIIGFIVLAIRITLSLFMPT